MHAENRSRPCEVRAADQESANRKKAPEALKRKRRPREQRGRRFNLWSQKTLSQQTLQNNLHG
jgi:hypothetical protein